MALLSITKAWDEAADIVRRDFGALFAIALAMIAIPNVALQALGPGRVSPGQTPEPGLWLLLGPVVLVLSIAGSLAISSLALGRENVVGAALARGFRRCLPVIGATLLLALGAVLIAFPVLLLLGVGLGELAAPTPATVGRLGLAILLLFLVFLAFWVRLMLITPVAAAEAGGPIAIISRSWRLTAGHFWKLLGFVLLLIVVVVVVTLVVSSLVGILVAAIAGRPEPGSVAALVLMLVGGVVNAALGVVFTTMVARIYVQLAGATSGS